MYVVEVGSDGHGPPPTHHIARHWPDESMTTACIAAWVAALLLFPLIVLLWATESREQRIRRWHRRGQSQRAIAARLGCSRYRVRKALA